MKDPAQPEPVPDWGTGEAQSRELDDTDVKRLKNVGDVEFTDSADRALAILRPRRWPRRRRSRAASTAVWPPLAIHIRRITRDRGGRAVVHVHIVVSADRVSLAYRQLR